MIIPLHVNYCGKTPRRGESHICLISLLLWTNEGDTPPFPSPSTTPHVHISHVTHMGFLSQASSMHITCQIVHITLFDSYCVNGSGKLQMWFYYINIDAKRSINPVKYLLFHYIKCYILMYKCIWNITSVASKLKSQYIVKFVKTYFLSYNVNKPDASSISLLHVFFY